MANGLSGFFEEYKEFWGLLIFGNIENLVLGSQGALPGPIASGVNPIMLGILSLILVVIWQLIGTFGTKAAIKYQNMILFIGGLAIFILGLQSMLGAVGLL